MNSLVWIRNITFDYKVVGGYGEHILRNQIKLLTCEKTGSYENAGHVFFIVQLFLGSNFL